MPTAAAKHEAGGDRLAYEELAIATVKAAGSCGTVVEARRLTNYTAGELKQEIFENLTAKAKLLPQANGYAREQSKEIGFELGVSELRSVS